MANRANQRVLLGCGLLCAAALLCAQWHRPERRGGASAGCRDAKPGGRLEFSDRLRCPPGRRRQADPLHPRSRQADPVSRLRARRSLPRRRRYSPGQFQARRRHRHGGAGAGQGVPLWPRDARRFADRVRSDGTGQNRQFLRAGSGQRPAAAAGARTGRGRPHRLRAVAGARKSPRTEARHRRSQRRRRAARLPRQTRAAAGYAAR